MTDLITDRNSDILEFLQNTRPAVYQAPRLLEGNVILLPDVTRHAERERRRRNEDHALFEELSRDYPLLGKRKKWSLPLLLKKGKNQP